MFGDVVADAGDATFEFGFVDRSLDAGDTSESVRRLSERIRIVSPDHVPELDEQDDPSSEGTANAA
jgi:hypothetical protein